ncbi:MAG: SDR family NAD(P)-dependent oxidoreductase [Deltaproteobacteria bacterium]|nr:SDR family NAD(P)-dependent oxidoreductase [Deltaproteobacteria bacterium]
MVTGANTGIGRIAALELAKRGAHVVITCRSLEKGAPVAEALQKESGNDKVECLALELSSL